MSEAKHLWTTFTKGRLKIQACSCCGELQTAGNIESRCFRAKLEDSLIHKAGYRMRLSSIGMYQEAS